MEPVKSMEQVIRDDGRYPPDAFAFLHEGLTKAVKAVHGQPEQETSPRRHVTGKQLCESLRDLAMGRWGMLAKLVLSRWNIRSTTDFGNMVYLLVNNGFMRKTDEDSLEDFRDVYDFTAAFDFKDQFDIIGNEQSQ